MPWDAYNRRNYPYIGPRRKVPVRNSPFFGSPFYEEEEIAPARRRVEPEVREPEEIRPKPATEAPAPEGEEVIEGEVVEKAAPAPKKETEDWKARALRLQAEMENFRKRQTRRAEEAVTAERERLLRRVLPVADNLNRALSHSNAEDGNLRQGVELINRELMRFLENEGVSPIEAVGQPFDPTVHEAIGVRPVQAEPDTVVDEVETGYKLGDKLLRPARVIVAAS